MSRQMSRTVPPGGTGRTSTPRRYGAAKTTRKRVILGPTVPLVFGAIADDGRARQSVRRHRMDYRLEPAEAEPLEELDRPRAVEPLPVPPAQEGPFVGDRKVDVVVDRDVFGRREVIPGAQVLEPDVPALASLDEPVESDFEAPAARVRQVGWELV